MVTAGATAAFRFAIVVTCLLTLGAVTARPVAAYTDVATRGMVGAHSLNDTRRSPGADCVYRFRDDDNAQVLRRIRIDPPNVRAVPGQGNQQVGWSFSIDRRSLDAFHPKPGPWERRYDSPVTTARTDASHDASFSPMGVRVYVPIEPNEDAWFTYRATVVVTWYRANGTVMGTATMRIDWFQSYLGADQEKQKDTCRSWIL